MFDSDEAVSLKSFHKLKLCTLLADDAFQIFSEEPRIVALTYIFYFSIFPRTYRFT